MKRKLIGIGLLVIGLILGIATMRSLFIDGSKTKEALNNAVYVGTDQADPANNGKTVIVCGEFKLTKPAVDDELGLSFDSICVSRNKQVLKKIKPDANDDTAGDYEKRHGRLEWTASDFPTKYFGSGKVGEYELSKEIIEKSETDKIFENYDNQALSKLGYIYNLDNSFAQKHFIKPLKQAQGSSEYAGDIRYYYSYNDIKNGSKVTVVGVQDGNTLKVLENIPFGIMQGEMDKDAFLENYGSKVGGASIFAIAVSVALLSGGAFLIFKKQA